VDVAIDKQVDVPMRDGCSLRADVYRPGSSERAPVLLMRTPYNKEMATSPDLMKAVAAGYCVVVQDTRGRYASSGTFDPFVTEQWDGEDTIAWAADRPWSSGCVGMFGTSYVGATQWLAAAGAPPALGAIAPNCTAADYYEGWTYQGGAFQLGFVLTWALTFLGLGEVVRDIGHGRRPAGQLAEVVERVDSVEALFRSMPLADLPLVGEIAPYFREWLEHASYDAYWRRIAPRERYDAVAAPSLNIGGWYDLFLGGTLMNYRGMLQSGATAAARRPELVIGPWAHANLLGSYPEVQYGLAGGALLADLIGQQLRWFDAHLRPAQPAVPGRRPVRIFVMGANAWREDDSWPLPGTDFVAYYLHGRGRANGRAGDGLLTPDPPGEEATDSYRYDPLNPVPTVGGATFLPGLVVSANAGPRDQRAVEQRQDVLCYATEPLSDPIEVIGPIELILYASSSARDTDFTGKLVDVHPDGRAEILTDGILRTRYRESLSEPQLLERDAVVELRIELGATAKRIDARHRLLLEVSSSNFPRFDRNTNTGGSIAEEREADCIAAVNRVFHDRKRPSHVILPIVRPPA
jgi:uncharacterized protein